MAAKRTLVQPQKGDKRSVRRDAKGRIIESGDVDRSWADARDAAANTTTKPGQGHYFFKLFRDGSEKT